MWKKNNIIMFFPRLLHFLSFAIVIRALFCMHLFGIFVFIFMNLLKSVYGLYSWRVYDRGCSDDGRKRGKYNLNKRMKLIFPAAAAVVAVGTVKLHLHSIFWLILLYNNGFKQRRREQWYNVTTKLNTYTPLHRSIMIFWLYKQLTTHNWIRLTLFTPFEI